MDLITAASLKMLQIKNLETVLRWQIQQLKLYSFQYDMAVISVVASTALTHLCL